MIIYVISFKHINELTIPISSPTKSPNFTLLITFFALRHTKELVLVILEKILKVIYIQLSNKHESEDES